MKFVLAVLAALLLFSLFMASQTPPAKSKEPVKENSAAASTPHLTGAQKLAIRDGQVKMMQLQKAVEQTPQWIAYQSSQQSLSETVTKVYKELGITVDKWQLSDNLEFLSVGQHPPMAPASPAAPPAPSK